MQKFDIILGSASPRRHEILTLAGLEHRIITSDANEGSVPFTVNQPEEYVITTAKLKNDAVLEELADFTDSTIVLTADTIVYFSGDDRPLGKPKDRDDAIRTITRLSGKSHKVVTGVVIQSPTRGLLKEFACSTNVVFRNLTDEEIIRYVDSGEPLDKAGSYGIQGGACSFVRALEGDYFNVVGLPICPVVEALREIEGI